MNKFIRTIRKYNFIIVIILFLAIMIGVMVGALSMGKDGLYFISSDAEGFCHDVHDMNDKDPSEYKNMTKIVDYKSDEPITKVNIEYYSDEQDFHGLTFIENGYNSEAFVIDWRNNADAYSIEMYLSCNLDGKSGDAFRKSLFSIDYEYAAGILKINLRKTKETNLHTFNNDELFKGMSEIEIINKLKIQFYTIVKD